MEQSQKIEASHEHNPGHNEHHSSKNWFDKYYKIILIIPIIVLILSLVYLGFFYSKTGNFILRDVGLSGGTSITLHGDIDYDKLESSLSTSSNSLSFRKLTDISSGKPIALIIESSSSPEELRAEIESVLGYPLTEENSSIEFTRSALGDSFYNELIRTIFASFILMSTVIFFLFGESKKLKMDAAILTAIIVKLIFNMSAINVLAIIAIIIFSIFSMYYSKSKKEFYLPAALILIFIISFFLPSISLYLSITLAVLLFASYLFYSPPSIAVIFAAFSDIIIPLAIIDYMGMKISAAGIAAFLMLIGYSVDTDILLTSRAIKNREGTLNYRIFRAFKTGIFMTLTALIAVLPAFFIVTGLPDSFRQIFLILGLGLASDIINTWMTNAGIIKWYCIKRGIE